MTAVLKATPLHEIGAIVAHSRARFDKYVATCGMNTRDDFAQRAHHLRKLRALIYENQDALMDAHRCDTGLHPSAGAKIVGGCLQTCDYLLENMVQLARGTEHAEKCFGAAGCDTVLQPRGVVLIFQTWNFPLPLAIKPLATAIATGNISVLKLSEVCTNFNSVFYPLLMKYMSPDVVSVIYGEVDVATEVLRHEFDLIFYTGNTQVGKIIMGAAAKYLTPCILELGGKNPVVVTASANVEAAARMIIDGRMKNAGQFCCAPDYVLVANQVKDAFQVALVEAVRAFFSEDPATSTSYGKVVSQRHTQRIAEYFHSPHGGKILCGGTADISKCFVAPTVIADPNLDSALMQEEIFGPILSVLGYDAVDDAISIINTHPAPLALYIFCNAEDEAQYVVARTRSGGVNVNDISKHMANETLPFGGVGASGMGNYHGVYGFRTFSHERAVLRFDSSHQGGAFPPYT